MITRDQFYILMALHQRGDNIFSTLPPEILIEIYQAKPSKNSDISKALNLAADAEQNAVDTLLAMLDKDPSLLLQAGNQAFSLLYNQWAALSSNDTNFDKCRLVYRQIISYLQRTLPGIDRIGFAKAFQDNKRLLNFIWDRVGRFPNSCGDDGSVLAGLGFDELIFGARRAAVRRGVARACISWGRYVSKFMSNKNFELTELMQLASINFIS